MSILKTSQALGITALSIGGGVLMSSAGYYLPQVLPTIKNVSTDLKESVVTVATSTERGVDSIASTVLPVSRAIETTAQTFQQTGVPLLIETKEIIETVSNAVVIGIVAGTIVYLSN